MLPSGIVQQAVVVTVLTAALLAGCSPGEGDTTIDIVFDPCQPIQLAPAADATDDELATIDQAVALWKQVAAVELSRDPSEPGAAVLPITFEDAPGAFRGVYEDEVGVVYVNRRLGPTGRAITLAHELGHAFGLLHLDSEDSVMNPANLVIEPLPADADRLSELWGQCVLLDAAQAR